MVEIPLDNFSDETRKLVRVPDKQEVDQVVDQIVQKWNGLVMVVQNTTIGLCLMIKEMTKEYPDATIKEVLQRVKQHPNVKRFVSVDRIWQGMRLIERRKELIDYERMTPEEKAKVPEENKPYLKPDGDIFWEYYFELAKHPLNEGILVQIEQEGKEKKWSFRELKQKIYEVKEEISDPFRFVNKRLERDELMKSIMYRLRMLTVEEVRVVFDYVDKTLTARKQAEFVKKNEERHKAGSISDGTASKYDVAHEEYEKNKVRWDGN
jgi:hypothetical protein